MRSELLPNGIDDLTDAVEDFIHGAQTVDVGEFSLFGVKVRDDGRLFVIYFDTRSEERRVGKECRSRWSPYH